VSERILRILDSLIYPITIAVVLLILLVTTTPEFTLGWLCGGLMVWAYMKG
jgi:hypothetical protein